MQYLGNFEMSNVTIILASWDKRRRTQEAELVGWRPAVSYFVFVMFSC